METHSRQTFGEENRALLLKRAEKLVEMLMTPTPPVILMNQVAMVMMTAAAYGSAHDVSPFEALGNRIASGQRKLQGYCTECEGEPNPCLSDAVMCSSCEASILLTGLSQRPLSLG